jgi:DNA-binding NtrC family response regulator
MPCRHTATSPFALVIDDDEDVCKLFATTLGDLGIECAAFSAAKPALASLDLRWPAIIFLDIALEQSDAIDVIRSLSQRQYSGTLQLISGQRTWLLEAVQRLALRHALTLRPPLKKPIEAHVIQAVAANALPDNWENSPRVIG